MPYASESPDKEKTNHKYKDKIPQKYITRADPSNSRVIMLLVMSPDLPDHKIGFIFLLHKLAFSVSLAD